MNELYVSMLCDQIHKFWHHLWSSLCFTKISFEIKIKLFEVSLMLVSTCRSRGQSGKSERLKEIEGILSHGGSSSNTLQYFEYKHKSPAALTSPNNQVSATYRRLNAVSKYKALICRQGSNIFFIDHNSRYWDKILGMIDAVSGIRSLRGSSDSIQGSWYKKCTDNSAFSKKQNKTEVVSCRGDARACLLAVRDTSFKHTRYNCSTNTVIGIVLEKNGCLWTF